METPTIQEVSSQENREEKKREPSDLQQDIEEEISIIDEALKDESLSQADRLALIKYKVRLKREANRGSESAGTGETSRGKKLYDAVDNSYSIESEAHYGEGRNLLSDGSGKRKDSKSPSKQVKRVDGRSRRYKEGRKTASERRKYCQTLKASGSVRRRIVYGHQCDVIPEEYYIEPMKKIAEKNSKNGIDETIFITGMAELPYVKDSLGKPKKAKGIFIKTKDGRKIVVVQYDNERFTPEQINDHELVHEELYEAYPQLKDVEVVFVPLGELGAGGAYFSQKISLPKELLENNRIVSCLFLMKSIENCRSKKRRQSSN